MTDTEWPDERLAALLAESAAEHRQIADGHDGGLELGRRIREQFARNAWQREPQFQAAIRALEQKVAELTAEAQRLRIMEREYDHFRDDDSPKGEFVPGVRYWVGV